MLDEGHVGIVAGYLSEAKTHALLAVDTGRIDEQRFVDALASLAWSHLAIAHTMLADAIPEVRVKDRDG